MVLEEVSVGKNRNGGLAVAAEGFALDTVVTTTESVVALDEKVTVTVPAVVLSDLPVVPNPAVQVPAEVRDKEFPKTAAWVGTTDIKPSPNEAAATSAMRLNVVFVDIIFLSIVVDETFPKTALRWVARADTSLFPKVLSPHKETFSFRVIN